MSELSVETTRILQEARDVSVATPRICSSELEAVRDEFTNNEIENWRHNGASKAHSLHSMVSRVGGFPPLLARYFVAAYSEPGDVVLDPFCGKGTTLFEAAAIGRRAIGGDIAPDAVLTSAAKCANVTVSQVANYIQELPGESGINLRGIPADVSLFYERLTLRRILAIRKQLLDDMALKGNSARKRTAKFVMGVLLGLLHGHSRLSLSLPCNQCFAMSPNYVRRYVEEHDLVAPRRNVKECLLEKALLMLPSPRGFDRVTTYLASADKCDKYMNRSKCKANLIITSPPYLNRQTYLKDSWLRLWLLGYDRKELASESFETGNVPFFISAMLRSLRAMWNSLLDEGILVLVCGRAKVSVGKRKRIAHVNELCALAASKCGEEGKTFAVEAMITDRVLMKRGSYFAVHQGKIGNGNGKKRRRYGEDEILILRKQT
jgi:hypothetical protein